MICTLSEGTPKNNFIGNYYNEVNLYIYIKNCVQFVASLLLICIIFKGILLLSEGQPRHKNFVDT